MSFIIKISLKNSFRGFCYYIIEGRISKGRQGLVSHGLGATISGRTGGATHSAAASAASHARQATASGDALRVRLTSAEGLKANKRHRGGETKACGAQNWLRMAALDPHLPHAPSGRWQLWPCLPFL